MKKRYILTVLTLMAGLTTTKAQYVSKQAQVEYDLYNYQKAAQLFEKAYQKRKSSTWAERAAESYSKIGDYAATEQWYALAIQATGSTEGAKIGYAKALIANEKYNEAKAVLQSLSNAQIDAKLLSAWIASCDTAQAWKKAVADASVEQAKNVNGMASDWAPSLAGNKLVFSSDRGNSNDNQTAGKPFLRFDGKTRKPSKDVFLWTNRSYYQLYQKAGDTVSAFPLAVKEGYHVGTSTFAADGKEMFFTLTKAPEVKKQKLATSHVEIYSAKLLDDGKWSAVEAFPFNKGAEYSLDDPFLQGDTLYFSSNKPGGKGGADLYYSLRKNGQWQEPVNIAWANTAGDERTPVADGKGNFYFASNGRVGMGGLDIYRANEKQQITNLKYPINTSRDDFAFTVVADKGIVYLSSDRMGGMGLDDIYSVDMEAMVNKWKEANKLWLAGTVYDKETKQALANANLEVKDAKGNVIRLAADGNGTYKVQVLPTSNYQLLANSNGYDASAEKLVTDTAHAYKLDFFLAKTQAPDENFTLPIIYYTFDKYDIRPDAAKILDQVLAIMNSHPTLKLALSSHTDSRGSDAYNMWLSQKRAESAMAYLVSHGIAKNRLTAKGFGETQLVNGCKNGINCSVPQHQANRRTEFKKIK